VLTFRPAGVPKSLSFDPDAEAELGTIG